MFTKNIVNNLYSIVVKDEEDQSIQFIEYFKKIEDLLNVAKMIEITDILHSFKFGFEKTKKFENPIDILRNEDKTVRNQAMKKYWTG